MRVYTHKSYRTFKLKADKNGIIRFDTSGLSAGMHVVKVFGEGWNIKLSRNTQFMIKIYKGSCRIAHPKSIKRHSNLKVEVLAMSKKPIAKTKFKVKINYWNYKLKTSSKGILEILASKLAKGKHNVKIVLKNKNYRIHKKF